MKFVILIFQYITLKCLMIINLSMTDPSHPHLQSEQYHPVHSVYSASGGASAGHSHLCCVLCKGQEEER